MKTDRTEQSHGEGADDLMSISSETLEQLAHVSTATLTTRLFALGLRNQFLVGLRPMNPDAASFVGEAFTLRYIPAREDIDTLDVFRDYDHPQRLAVESVGPGQVLIVDARLDSHAASLGHILLTRLLRRGAAAFITDGGLRDTPEMARTPFPAFATGPSATTNLARHHAVDMQIPIGCAGVPIYPGDILVGDEEGVVCIPRHLATDVASKAADQEVLEQFILKEVDGGAALRGIYPPNEKTIARFQAMQSEEP